MLTLRHFIFFLKILLHYIILYFFAYNNAYNAYNKFNDITNAGKAGPKASNK